MWLCSRCKHKNNNSSQRCHGHNCKAERNKEAYELPIQITKVQEAKKVYDYCPNCKKDTFWISKRYKGKGGYWGCMECNRTAKLIGKSKPIPEGISIAEIC